MAPYQPLTPWRLTVPEALHGTLFAHLFPGDNDEHGAVILAGAVQSDRGLRLVARELHLAQDDIDYVPGKFGYRMLRAEFIQRCIVRARDQRLAYLAIHNHGGTTTVDFSADDFASHERGYPALLDVARGMPVGALVFAQGAAAGDLWLPDRRRAVLARADIVGRRRLSLYPAPPPVSHADPRHDRQVRLFGAAGQAILRSLRIGIIGVGGAGSILAELLARLGVGEFILVDPDHVELTNLPRLIGARLEDAGTQNRRWRKKNPLTKVELAMRNIRAANPKSLISTLTQDFCEGEVAARFTDCDYLFLAADSMRARLLFNAIVHQYGIPGVQVGAKVPVDPKSGQVGDVFCVARWVTPGEGCLWCNGLISAQRLQDEAVPTEARRGFAYVDDPEVVAPSVMTLNAVACAHAADEFLFHVTGLKKSSAEPGWFRWSSRDSRASRDLPSADPDCSECSSADHSRLGRGDGRDLPCR